MGLGSEMGEKVDFHLLTPEEEETSLLTLLAPDLRPCEPVNEMGVVNRHPLQMVDYELIRIFPTPVHISDWSISV